MSHSRFIPVRRISTNTILPFIKNPTRFLRCDRTTFISNSCDFQLFNKQTPQSLVLA